MFVVNDHTKIEHVQTQQDDDEKAAQRDAVQIEKERRELLDEVHQGFSTIDRRFDRMDERFDMLGAPPIVSRRLPHLGATPKVHGTFPGDISGPSSGLEK